MIYDVWMREENMNVIHETHAYLTISGICNAYTKRGPDKMLHT